MEFEPPTPFALEEEPRALTTLLTHPDPETRTAAQQVAAHFTWPGAVPTSTLTPTASPRTEEEVARLRAGESVYHDFCASCHQRRGLGLPGKAPPLAGSEWVVGPPDRLARIILHGVYGRIPVHGQEWNLHMPAAGAGLNDEKIAQVLTYVRGAWGNASSAVETERVARIRKETSSRILPWRAEELTGGTPDEPAPGIVVGPGSDGILVLAAQRATRFGPRPTYSPSLNCLGRWSGPEDAAEWTLEIPSDSTYEIRVLLAAGRQSEGNRFVLQSDTGSVSGVVQATESLEQFREIEAGRLSFSRGVHRLLLRPDGIPRGGLAEIRGLRLIPVGPGSPSGPPSRAR